MKEKKIESTLSMKLISLGDVEVGKSCLIKRYCEGNFIEDYITTIGIDYGVKKVPFNDIKVNFYIIKRNFFNTIINTYSSDIIFNKIAFTISFY